jgi:hypothetical protein
MEDRAAKGSQPAKDSVTLQSPGGAGPVILASICAALTGGLIAAALSYYAPDALRLGQVPFGELEAAIVSMEPAQRANAAEEARACKTPLAFVTVAAAEGQQAPQALRIRSGSYLSPPLTITPSPRRIALPFPAPYPAGQGVISVEGDAQGVTVSLSPAWQASSLNGAAPINVVWTPRAAC